MKGSTKKINKFQEEEKWVNDYNNQIKPIVFKPYYFKSKKIKASKEVKALFWPIIK